MREGSLDKGRKDGYSLSHDDPSRIGPALAPLKRLAAACIPDGTPLPILRGPLRGYWWLAGAAPGPAKGLSVVLNRSEAGQLREAERFAFPGSECLDIGAHAGMYSLLFSRHARKVYAFEPFPRNLGWLARTLALNRVANTQVVPWAVAGRTGVLKFLAGAHNSEGRISEEGDIPVFAVTCDEFCSRFGAKPNLVKIDVEGAEAEVLRGGRDMLRRCKPAVLLSTHGDAVKEECFKVLSDLGYGAPKPLNGPNASEASEFSIES